MARIELAELDGGVALCDWFEDSPSFHDAKLVELVLRQGAPGSLQAYTFRIGPSVDAEGCHLLEKRVVVTFEIDGLVEAELFEFADRGYMDGLEIDRDESGITLRFEAAYGVHGRIKAKRVAITFAPGKPSD
jgi:hypothetical protein